ncbi:MAG: glycosyltransferase [Phycisphaerae bacterium]|nr:glycosyltransferase [Phycisphaerae bacterium]
MNTENVGICITARVDSKRLPNKILRKIGKKRALRMLCEHVIMSNRNFKPVLAIPASAENDKIVRAVEEDSIPIEIYRGEDDSPLHRLVAVGKKYGWEYIIRVTADDLFIDMTLLRKQVNFCLSYNLDYTYMGKCPEGFAAEVIRLSTLEDIVREVGDKPVEFVSYYLKREGVNYKEFYPEGAYQYPQLRMTLDYPEDLAMIRAVLSQLPHDANDTLSIITHVKHNKWLMNLNRLPRVSVYIVNYNYEDFVVDAIESVLNQSYRDFELHIWDDCSTDTSVKTISQYLTSLSFEARQKCQLFVNDANMGLPAMCNKAVARARGRYILRLDADDLLESNALEVMTNALDGVGSLEDSKISGVFSHYRELYHPGGLKSKPKFDKKHPGCCMLLRGCVNEIKYRDGLERLEGDEFFARYEKAYKTAVLDDCLWQYRRHARQKTANDK